MRHVGAVLASSWLWLLGCTSLPTIESGVCGNAVLEPDLGEACDTFVEDRGQICRPPGDVGECQYDCRLGSDGHRPHCPDHHGCGADGICRRDTRGYQEPRLLSSDATSWLASADFDGDSRVDLVSSELLDQTLEARFHVHYFGADSRSLETRTFPRVSTRPVVRDVNDDGRDDFVFSNFRVGMVPGRADREWVPATFSSYQVPNAGILVVGVHDDYVGGASGLAALTAFDAQPGIYVPDYKTARLGLRKSLPGPVQDLVGTPLAARIVEGVDSPCYELVLAYRGANEFRMFDLCQLTTDPALPDVLWRDEPLEQVVTLPPGVYIDAAPISADVNGDGHLDVIVGAGDSPYVALGDGQRLEPAAALLQVAIDTEKGVAMKALTMPLAAGDLSGDGVADFVMSDFILTSRPRLALGGLSYFASLQNRGAPWTMAEVADLNGNGKLDVIAAAEGAPGLTFMNGTGGPYQVGASLPTEGPVRFLSVGDFDGDLIADVAYVEKGPPTEGTDFLSVAFGTRDTPPLGGKRVAEVKDVEQLGRHAEHGLDNVFVTSHVTLSGEPFSTLTLFDSNPDRLPFAPYALVTFSVDGQLEDSAAAAVVVGSFGRPQTGDAKGSHDVVALGTQDPTQAWTQWLAPDIASGQHPPRLLKGTQPEGIVPATVVDGRVTFAVAGLAADLDRDGFDEVLWLMPEGADGCALTIFGINARAQSAQLKSSVHFDEPCSTPELQTADLDQQNGLDILALLGDPLRAPRRLRLLWNDGSGQLSSESSSIVGIPAESDVRAFSVFPGAKRLAVVTAGALHVVSPFGDNRQFDAVADVWGLDDARAVLVFDPNADRVSDIAVADAEGIRLFEARLE